MSLAPLSEILDRLERYHGTQAPQWPTDPYQFLVWWHCGYPASDERCASGWESLNGAVGVEPERLLSVASSTLTRALKPGGMVPERRAARLKAIAERVQERFRGDLLGGLRALPATKARTELKQFPGIGTPGADRILLFGGVSPEAAVPSNCPHVLPRIQTGRERPSYALMYAEAQRMLEAHLPVQFDARRRAYLLLKCHGQTLCKRTKPKCGICPLAPCCAFARRLGATAPDSGGDRGRRRPGN